MNVSMHVCMHVTSSICMDARVCICLIYIEHAKLTHGVIFIHTESGRLLCYCRLRRSLCRGGRGERRGADVLKGWK